MVCVIKRRQRFGISSLLEYSGVFSECGFLFSILKRQCQVFVTTPLFKKKFCYYTYFVCVWRSVYKYMCVCVCIRGQFMGGAQGSNSGCQSQQLAPSLMVCLFQLEFDIY